MEVPRDRVGLMFTRREVTAFVGSMRTAGRVISCTAETVASCTAAILVVSFIIDTKLRLICLLASAVLNWSVTHLFASLGRPNRLRELKHLA